MPRTNPLKRKCPTCGAKQEFPCKDASSPSGYSPLFHEARSGPSRMTIEAIMRHPSEAA